MIDEHTCWGSLEMTRASVSLSFLDIFCEQIVDGSRR